MNNVIPLDFEGSAVRGMVDQDDMPWFVGKDVCGCLEIEHHRNAIGRLEDDERGSILVNTLGGPQNMAAVNEPGIFRLVFTSRSDAAERFKRWLAHDVLPTLRREGRYEIQDGEGEGADPLNGQDPADMRLYLHMVDTCLRVKSKAEARRLWDMLPLPSCPGSAAETSAIESFVAETMETAPDAREPLANIANRYGFWRPKGFPHFDLREIGRHLRAAGVTTAKRRVGNKVVACAIGWRLVETKAEDQAA